MKYNLKLTLQKQTLNIQCKDVFVFQKTRDYWKRISIEIIDLPSVLATLWSVLVPTAIIWITKRLIRLYIYSFHKETSMKCLNPVHLLVVIEIIHLLMFILHQRQLLGWSYGCRNQTSIRSEELLWWQCGSEGRRYIFSCDRDKKKKLRLS